MQSSDVGEIRKQFLVNVEAEINSEVDLPRIKNQFRTALKYARCKTDFVLGGGLYKIPSDTDLHIDGYNSSLEIAGEDTENIQLGENNINDEPAITQPSDFDDPSIQPDDPSIHPDDPSIQPDDFDDPSIQPDDPSIHPDDPSIQPDDFDDPSIQPDDPSIHPDDPSIQPDDFDDPSIQPDDPSIQPASIQPNEAEISQLTHDETKLVITLSAVIGGSFLIWYLKS